MQLTLPITIRLARKKGSSSRKLLGLIWVPLILATSLSSFFINSDGKFSWVHTISVVNILYIGLSYISMRGSSRPFGFPVSIRTLNASQ